MNRLVTTKPLVRVIAMLIVLIAFASACGSSTSTDSAGGSTDGAVVNAPGFSRGSDDLANCDLLSDAFLASVIGEAPEPEDGQADVLDSLSTSSCDYTASAGFDGDGVHDFYEISIARYPSGHMADEFFEVEPVDGLGDEAHLDIVESLWVRQGEAEFKIVLNKVFLSEVTDEQELAVQRSIAEEILSNL